MFISNKNAITHYYDFWLAVGKDGRKEGETEVGVKMKSKNADM